MMESLVIHSPVDDVCACGGHSIGTAKDKVVEDYGRKMLVALEHTDTIIQHSSQALLLGNNVVADSLHFSLVGSN